MGLSYSYCWRGNGFVEKVTTWTPQRKETRETTGCWKRRVRKTKVEQLWREVKRDVRKLQRKKITWNRKQVFTPTPVGKMPKPATNNNNILKKRAYNTTHKLKKRLLKFLQCNNDIVLGDNWNQRKKMFLWAPDHLFKLGGAHLCQLWIWSLIFVIFQIFWRLF